MGAAHEAAMFRIRSGNVGLIIQQTNLIRRRVQAQQVVVAPLQACFGIAAVHVLWSCTLQHRRQESVRGGVLQVKDTGGPAPSGSLVEAD